MKFLPALILAAAMLPPPAFAAGDPVLGKKQFGPCTVCHKVDAAAPDAVGPNLFGVYGSKAATRRTKFAYSPALKAAKLTWDDATLDKWLAAPGDFVKGTKMEFIGLPASRPATM